MIWAETASRPPRCHSGHPRRLSQPDRATARSLAVDHLAAEGRIAHENADTWVQGFRNTQSRTWAHERLIACVGELPIWLSRLKEVLRVKNDDSRLVGGSPGIFQPLDTPLPSSGTGTTTTITPSKAVGSTA